MTHLRLRAHRVTVPDRREPRQSRDRGPCTPQHDADGQCHGRNAEQCHHPSKGTPNLLIKRKQFDKSKPRRTVDADKGYRYQCAEDERADDDRHTAGPTQVRALLVAPALVTMNADAEVSVLDAVRPVAIRRSISANTLEANAILNTIHWVLVRRTDRSAVRTGDGDSHLGPGNAARTSAVAAAPANGTNAC
jgi:hypothetical protein